MTTKTNVLTNYSKSYYYYLFTDKINTFIQSKSDFNILYDDTFRSMIFGCFKTQEKEIKVGNGTR